MPTAPPRVCARCRRPTPPGRCPTCDASWVRKPQSWSGGSTRRWRKLRRAKLDHNIENNHGLCERAACPRIAVEVHHTEEITTEADRYRWDILEALCAHHHGIETREQARRAQWG